MSQCSTCFIQLSEDNAYRKNKERLQSQCKSCFNLYCVNRWKRLKLEAINSFGNECYDCKTSYHYSVYEFHHLDMNTKDFDWSQIRLKSKAIRQRELSKCIMLCANCHRIRHYSNISEDL